MGLHPIAAALVLVLASFAVLARMSVRICREYARIAWSIRRSGAACIARQASRAKLRGD